MFKLTIAATALVASSFTLAQPRSAPFFQTGNDLYSNCSADKDSAIYTYQFASCFSYIQAISDTVELTRASNGYPVCLPDGVNAGQLADVVRKDLELHPERRHEPAAVLVSNAIVAAFCPSPQKATG